MFVCKINGKKVNPKEFKFSLDILDPEHKCMMNNGKCLPSTMSRGCWVKLSIPSYLFSVYVALDESLHESIWWKGGAKMLATWYGVVHHSEGEHYDNSFFTILIKWAAH